MKGWIKSIRKQKELTFVAITDGKKDHQLTIRPESKITGDLKVGASFTSTGYDSVTPSGFAEFVIDTLDIIGGSDDTYPIQPKQHTDDFLRTIPELRGKTKRYQAIWKIRHHLTQEIHKFFDSEDIYLYTGSLITSADCEGAGETFDVKSDWMYAKLTVSSQLYGEIGARSLGKIYTFGPCFRAEKSSTKKHLSEFYMVEPELSWFDLDEIIKFSERFIKKIIHGVILKSEYEFKQLGITTEHLSSILDKDWKIVKYKEISELFGIKWGDDISSEMEQTIVKFYKSPVFITHYPKDLKPFYMKKDGQVAFCYDLIFESVGELIGGSEREFSYDVLKHSMIESGIDIEKMKWYLDLRKYGSTPTSGFGMGFERLLMFITKASKIHDVIPFPVSY